MKMGETPQRDAKEELYKINVDAARYFSIIYEKEIKSS